MVKKLETLAVRQFGGVQWGQASKQSHRSPLRGRTDVGQLLLQINRMKDKHEARRFQGISPAGAISAWKGSDISSIRVAGGTRRKGGARCAFIPRPSLGR